MARLGKNFRVVTTCIVVLMISGASAVAPAGLAEHPQVSSLQVDGARDMTVEPVPAGPKKIDRLADEEPVAAEEEPLPVRMASTRKTENLFAGHSWYTPPPPPPSRKVMAPVRREPTAPPLPYKLLGTYEQRGSSTLYFLVRGDRVFDVTIGDTLEGTYSVDGVTDNQLMLTYLPLDTSQGLRLGEE